MSFVNDANCKIGFLAEFFYYSSFAKEIQQDVAFLEMFKFVNVLTEYSFLACAYGIMLCFKVRKYETSASAGLQDANPTIRPYILILY